MNSLAEDREEVEGRVKGWVARKRREAFLAPSDPSTWFAYLEPDDLNSSEQHLVTLGRSPGDVLLTASMYAERHLGAERGTGRWLVENNAGDEGTPSIYLVVRPKLDEDAPRYEEEAS